MGAGPWPEPRAWGLEAPGPGPWWPVLWGPGPDGPGARCLGARAQKRRARMARMALGPGTQRRGPGARSPGPEPQGALGPKLGAQGRGAGPLAGVCACVRCACILFY